MFAEPDIVSGRCLPETVRTVGLAATVGALAATEDWSCLGRASIVIGSPSPKLLRVSITASTDSTERKLPSWRAAPNLVEVMPFSG